MKLIHCNQQNRDFEKKFDQLMTRVFGLSFEPWNELQLWDENYDRFVIENEEGLFVSSVCVYKVQMKLGDHTFHAYQIGGVATLPEYEKQGLSRKLLEHVIERFGDHPMYLFANPAVTEFYPKFDFQRVIPSIPVKDVNLDQDTQPKKATVYDAVKLAQQRSQFSEVLDVVDAASINAFHYVLAYPDDLYWINDHTIIVAQRQGTTLYLIDVIASQPITFKELEKLLPFQDIDKLSFGFIPDFLDTDYNWMPSNTSHMFLFLRGNWPLPEKFRFPATTET